MVMVQGVPDFPFHMPGSAQLQGAADRLVAERAAELVRQGYKAGAYIHPGDEYLGRTLEVGDLYYQHPQVPGHHFQQQYVEGQAAPPVMLPGELSDRIALELAEREARAYQDDIFYSPTVKELDSVRQLTPAERGYARILQEAKNRAQAGNPIRLPR